MRTHVRFRSAQFAPQGFEPGRVSEERYGYALAAWVATQLRRHDVAVDAPEPEDWGWMLGAAHDGGSVTFNCGNVQGSTSDWMVWIERGRPGLLARLLGRGVSDAAIARFARMLDGALRENPSVDDIEWFRVGSRGEELDHAATPT